MELNNIARAVGTVIRFNSDEVRYNTNRDGTSVFSPTTTRFNASFPQLLKVR